MKEAVSNVSLNLLEVMAKEYKSENESIGVKHCKLMKIETMDQYYTSVMFKTLYLTQNQSRLLRSWVNTHLGWSLFASAKSVGHLWKDYIRPDFKSWTDETDNNKIEFWDKPIEALILHRLVEYFNQHCDTHSIAKVDFLLSGDHGADTFSLVLKIIILDHHGKCIHHIQVAAADIASKKDSYEILRQTIAPRLNKMIQDIKEGNNSHLYLYQLGQIVADRVYNASFVRHEGNPVSTPAKIIPFQFLIVGDLKWLNQMLGKVNMEGHWCIWCNLCKKDWKEKIMC